MKPATECHALLEQILLTWNPPLMDDHNRRDVTTCVKTAAVAVLAYVLDDVFPWHILNVQQKAVVAQAERVFDGWAKQRGKGVIVHMATTTCQICFHRQEVPTYDDWECESCGQEYTYEEGHILKLSEDQLTLLRGPILPRDQNG